MATENEANGELEYLDPAACAGGASARDRGRRTKWTKASAV